MHEKDTTKLWKAQMSKIINEENEWDQISDAVAVEGPIESDERRDNGGAKILDDWKGTLANRGLHKNDSS